MESVEGVRSYNENKTGNWHEGYIIGHRDGETIQSILNIGANMCAFRVGIPSKIKNTGPVWVFTGYSDAWSFRLHRHPTDGWEIWRCIYKSCRFESSYPMELKTGTVLTERIPGTALAKRIILIERVQE